MGDTLSLNSLLDTWYGWRPQVPRINPFLSIPCWILVGPSTNNIIANNTTLNSLSDTWGVTRYIYIYLTVTSQFLVGYLNAMSSGEHDLVIVSQFLVGYLILGYSLTARYPLSSRLSIPCWILAHIQQEPKT